MQMLHPIQISTFQMWLIDDDTSINTNRKVFYTLQ